MRLTIRPSAAPDTEIDLTHALTAAVAHELWRYTRGNDVLNWLEAERYVRMLAAQAGTAGMAAPAASPQPRAEEARPGRATARPTRRKGVLPLPSLDGDGYTGPLPILGPR